MLRDITNPEPILIIATMNHDINTINAAICDLEKLKAAMSRTPGSFEMYGYASQLAGYKAAVAAREAQA